jgi:hypothetical protein
VLAILPGQIVTLSDVEAAMDLGLVEVPAGADRIAGGLSALIDRMLMLNEVTRVAPPEPSPAAIEGGCRASTSGSGRLLTWRVSTRGLTKRSCGCGGDDLRLACT